MMADDDAIEFERSIMLKMRRDMEDDRNMSGEFEDRIGPFLIDISSIKGGTPIVGSGCTVLDMIDRSEDILLQFQRLTGRQTSSSAILRVVGATVDDDSDCDEHFDSELDNTVTGKLPYPDDNPIFVPLGSIGLGSLDEAKESTLEDSSAIEGISHVDICIYRMKLILSLARAILAVITGLGDPSSETLVKMSYSLLTLSIMRGTMRSIVDARMTVSTKDLSVGGYTEKARAVERCLMEELSEVLVQSSMESELRVENKRGLMKNTMGIFYAISEAHDPTDIATSISIAMRESCAPRRGEGGISANVKSEVIDGMDAGAAGVASAMIAAGASIPIGTRIPAPQAGNRVDFLRPESNGRYPIYQYSGSMESAHTDAVRARSYFLMAHIGTEPFNPVHDMPHIDSGGTFPVFSPIMCCDYGQCTGLARVTCLSCKNVHYCSRNHRDRDRDEHYQICGDSGPYVDLEVAVEALAILASDTFSWCISDEVVGRVLLFYDWCWRHLLIVNDGVVTRAITLSYGDDEESLTEIKTPGVARSMRRMGACDPSILDSNILQSMRQEKLPSDPFESIDAPELFWVRAGIVEACRYIYMRGAFNVIGENFIYNGKTGEDVAEWFGKVRKVDDPESGLFTHDIYQKALSSSRRGRAMTDLAISIIRANSRDPDIKGISRTINMVLCDKSIPSPVGMSISILVTSICMADDDFFFMEGMTSNNIHEYEGEEVDGIPQETVVDAVVKSTAPLFIRPYLWLAYCDTSKPDMRSMYAFFRVRFKNAMSVPVVSTAVSRLCSGFLRVMVTKKRFAKSAALIREGNMQPADFTHIVAYRKAVESLSGAVITKATIDGSPAIDINTVTKSDGRKDVSCIDIRYPHEGVVETLLRLSDGSRKEVLGMVRGSLGVNDDITGPEVSFASSESKEEVDEFDDIS